MNDRALKIIAGFGTAFAILALFTWLVGWADIAAAVARASPRLLLAGAFVAFLGPVAMGGAWLLVVRNVAPYSLLSGYRAFYAAMFANAVTPLGQFGGEPFIAYVVSRDAGVQYEESFAAVLSADLVNSVQFFTLSLAGAALFYIYYPVGRDLAVILNIILAVLALFITLLVLFWRRQAAAVTLMGRLGDWIDRVATRLGRQDGILGRIDGEYLRAKTEHGYVIVGELLRQPRTVLGALAISHLGGVLFTLGLYLIILSLGVDAPLPALFLIVPASVLAGYLPLPGGLGGIEIALTFLLTSLTASAALTTIPLPVASAAALLFRASTYGAILVIGGISFSQFSVSLFTEG